MVVILSSGNTDWWSRNWTITYLSRSMFASANFSGSQPKILGHHLGHHLGHISTMVKWDFVFLSEVSTFSRPFSPHNFFAVTLNKKNQSGGKWLHVRLRPRHNEIGKGQSVQKKHCFKAWATCTVDWWAELVFLGTEWVVQDTCCLCYFCQVILVDVFW